MEKMNSVILAILISAGAISLSTAAVNKIPAIWSFILPWLRPPYLHVVINVIIIAIAAASRSRRSQTTAPPVRPQHLISVKTPPPAYYADYSPPPEVRDVVEVPEAVYEREDRVLELKAVMVNGFEVGADGAEEEEVVAGDESEDAMDGSTLKYYVPSPERFSPEFQSEYFPPADPTGNILERESTRKKSGEEVRHGGGRRPVRKSKSFKERSVDYASRAEASLSRNRRVEASVDRSLTRNSLLPQNPIGSIPSRFKEAAEEYETMESTWKKITEGASRAAVGEEACLGVGPPLRKSSSFSEWEIYKDSPSSSGIRKEESPSQDELNRRVEAFIQKVYGEIRLRRQNSSNQYIQLNSAA